MTHAGAGVAGTVPLMSILGTRVIRKEDPTLLTVGGSYVDDLAPADALYATFVRSSSAHAEIRGIDVSEALGRDGVVAVFTADDLELTAQPPSMGMLNQSMLRTWLASDRVRYVGEPVAVVVSTTAEAGADAADVVIVDDEPLPVVVDPHDSVTDTTLLFPDAGTNVVLMQPAAVSDDFFASCEVTAHLEFANQRLAPCPLEPRAAVARWGVDDEGRPHLTQWSSTQGAHGTRTTLAGAVGVDETQVRVICPDVGGGFGAKNGGYPEDIVVALVARRLDRPIRWAETRWESMLGLAHGRGANFSATIGGTRDGNITHYAVHELQDGGAYPNVGSVLPVITKRMATGVYDIANVDFSSHSVVTNTVPVGAYRGAGRPQATHAIERMIDLYAAEIGLDPVDVRRRNFIEPAAFPFTTPTGADMDTGAYASALDRVLAAVDIDELRSEQQRRRRESATNLIGIGWSAYVEIANPVVNGEFGSIEIQSDGSAVVLTGSSSHGQGHATAFAQLASEITGIDLDCIEVRHGDTDEVPRGSGTGGSKSLQIGGSAVWQASEAVVEQAKQTVAAMFEAAVDDIIHDPATGEFSVAGTPAITTSWAELAVYAIDVDQAPLRAEIDFQPTGATYPFGVHLSIVDVDRETGHVRVLRHVSCDDAGTIVNPMLVEGQLHGGAASGVAQALMEEFVYDSDGNPQTANLAEYALVSAAELPNFETISQETPTPRNPLGVKGVGESATIGATPAVQNAVVDALAHLGVRHVDIPVTSERVWEAINRAGSVVETPV